MFGPLVTDLLMPSSGSRDGAVSVIARSITVLQGGRLTQQ
jgi:hypothetical protein